MNHCNPLPAVRIRARGGTLVLGGGFAGSYVARRLGRRGATVVNPSNFMLYTPLLPEAAAGSIEPRHVTVPLRAMCPHADLLLGSVVGLDAERRIVHVESEAGTFEVEYDDLVVALGSVTRMPPVPGLREHAFGLKDLTDAIRLRNQVLRQIELADAAPESAAQRLDVRDRRRRVRRRRDDRRAPGTGGRRAPPAPAAGRRHAALDPGRPRAADPRPDSGRPCGIRGADAQPARHRDPHRDGARLGRRERRAALRRTPDRRRHGRVDGRREGQPAAGQARAALRRTRARAGRRDTASRRDARCLVARRRRCGPERGDAGRARPADVPARAAPGPPARAQPARHAAALPLPHARPDGHARSPPRHRGDRPRARARGDRLGVRARLPPALSSPSRRAACA